MRILHQEPEATDFISAAEYEASAPPAFGLPEQPVLYFKGESGEYTLYVVSDGVYLWKSSFGVVYNFEEVEISNNLLKLPYQQISLPPKVASDLARAVDRCRTVFQIPLNDSVEIAVPLDIENGDADDLGQPEFGNEYASYSSMASKRGRDYA